MAAVGGSNGATSSATPGGAGAGQSTDHFSMSARPTCPSVLIPFENQLYALPVQKLVRYSDTPMHSLSLVLHALHWLMIQLVVQ
jgi:hypothetical protein